MGVLKAFAVGNPKLGIVTIIMNVDKRRSTVPLENDDEERRLLFLLTAVVRVVVRVVHASFRPFSRL
jgi:hypothetical protein